MDELSPLFQEIEFHERLRGYDPDEVDAYVDRVARAAALMRGRLIELQQRVEAAEARAQGAPASTITESEETLTRTLVLAQRTADAAIAEAREEADRLTADAATSARAIVSAAEADAQVTLRESQAEAAAILREAEERASLLLAEAETDRRAMLAEAEATAQKTAAEERDRLAAEIAELQEYRAFIADDIEILERHLAEERHQLAASLSALTDLLESPEAFRVSRPPATSGVEVDPARLEPVASADSEPEVLAEAEAEPEPDGLAADEPLLDESLLDEPLLEELTSEDAVLEKEAAADELMPAAASEEEASEEAGPDDPMIDLSTHDTVPPEAIEDGDTAPADAEAHEDVVFTEIDLDAPASDDDPSGGWPGQEPAWADEPLSFAGRVESRLEIPAEAPPRFVTAADLGGVDGGSQLGFDDAGPATAPVAAVGDVMGAEPATTEASLFDDEAAANDDPFLAQLREAMEGDQNPDEDDDALTAFFDQEDDDGGRSWFGRRR